MFQTLLHIPHEDPYFHFPIFGLGWALGGWIVICLLWLLLLSRVPNRAKELGGALPMMAIVALMIVLIAPRMEVVNALGEVEGVPIRGYGVMMLCAIVVGVGLAVYRAKRMGIDPEIMFSLALWMCVVGVIGARAFFVIQKWNEQFKSDDIAETLTKIVSFTEGGLVVFGSAIGALLALVVFCRLRKLPTLAIADLVAPSMMFGLAIGRIGCLANGCCYGGYCDTQLALAFPQEAPVYIDQLMSGDLYGATFVERADDDNVTRVYVATVRPGSAAAEAGIEPGDHVRYLSGYKIDSLVDVRYVHAELVRHLQQNKLQDKPTPYQFNTLPAWTLPERSLPVHPTQIYSAIDAVLLGAVLWFFYPFRRRDGEVIALMLTLHPISRFLLEIVRIDEGGALGTPFTISQLVGFLFLGIAIVMWVVIERRPRGTALPIP